MRRYFFQSIAFVAIATIVGLSSCKKPPSKPDYDETTAVHSKFSGQKAYDHVAALVNFGPRPAGSTAIEESRKYIEAELNKLGWTVERQAFTTPLKSGVEFVNLRARYQGATEVPVGLLCSHYDTKPFSGFEFVGANDAGSSTGALIEAARALAEKPSLAKTIELVFFDGEEAFGTNITAKDGLFGSRYYASKWVGKEDKPKWGVLLDMIGDRDLKVRAGVLVPPEGIRELAKKNPDLVVDLKVVQEQVKAIGRQMLEASEDLGARSSFGISSSYITDDHIPLITAAGIPTIDIIDFDFDYWHTPGDTLDKISAESLETVGRVSLLLIEKYLD